jgi:hypothetical protein
MRRFESIFVGFGRFVTASIMHRRLEEQQVVGPFTGLKSKSDQVAKRIRGVIATKNTKIHEKGRATDSRVYSAAVGG